MSESVSSSSSRPILVVEDDQDLRDVLVTVLQARGLAVRSVGNGQEALEWLLRHPARWLLLLDLTMPVMDGETFLGLAERDPRLREVEVVTMTAGGQPHQLAHLARVKGWLPKPMTVETLLRVVAPLLPP
jgi:CheY-like chemotaxis protein